MIPYYLGREKSFMFDVGTAWGGGDYWFTRKRGEKKKREGIRAEAQRSQRKRNRGAKPPISFLLRGSASPREEILCSLGVSARIL
jgi:hypothetical protein